MSRRDRTLTDLARRLRRNQTDAERFLWSKFRARQLNGARFRRQFPLAPYIADFCCEEARLIIEIDGGQHDAGREQDRVRTEFFERRGYRVIRFWNTDVLRNVDGVLEEVTKCLASPSP